MKTPFMAKNFYFFSKYFSVLTKKLHSMWEKIKKFFESIFWEIYKYFGLLATHSF